MHPTFAFGNLTPCGGTQPDEFIFVAWPDNQPVNARCGGTQQLEDMRWHWAAYDTATNTWYPNHGSADWLIDQDTAWPDCIANPIDVTGPGGAVGWNSTNEPFVSVAALNNQVVFAYDRSGTSGLGTRIQMKGFTLQCKGNKLIPVAGPSVQSPDPCYRPGGGCGGGDGGGTGGNGPDGGFVTVDEWGPVVSFLPNPPSNPPLVVTWYTTRDDPTFNNQYATVYVGRAFGLFSDPFINIMPAAAKVLATDQVPWDHNSAPWWDYQALAKDPSSDTFLAAWGGDGRTGAPSGAWTARIFP